MQNLYLMNAAPFLEETVAQDALSLVEPARRERIMQIRDNKNRARSLAAGVLLCYAVNLERKVSKNGSALCVTPADGVQVLASLTEAKADGDFRIPITEPLTNGKPYFKDRQGMFFNLSHSGEYVACALADCEIGVDIQQYRKNIKEGVLKKVLHEKEKEEYQNCTEEEKEGLFYRIWAAKEAYAKYTGEGLAVDFRRLCADFFIGEITDDRTGKKCRLQIWEKLPGYAVAVVNERKII